MCCITLVSILLQSELSPFRRSSDNHVALQAQVLVFVWVGLLLRLVGMFEREAAAMAVGVFLCVASLSVLVAALVLANNDRLKEQRAGRRGSMSNTPINQQLNESASNVEIELVTLGSDAASEEEQADANGQKTPGLLQGRSASGDEKVEEDGENPPPINLPWSLLSGNVLCGAEPVDNDDTTPTTPTT